MRQKPLYKTTTKYLQSHIVSIETTRSPESVRFVGKVAKWARKIQGCNGLAGDAFYTSFGVQVRISGNLEVNRKMTRLLIYLAKKDFSGQDTTKAFKNAKDFFANNKQLSK